MSYNNKNNILLLYYMIFLKNIIRAGKLIFLSIILKLLPMEKNLNNKK